jgi:hypothetical protein
MWGSWSPTKFADAVVVLHFHATEELPPLKVLRDCECAARLGRKVLEAALSRIDAVEGEAA